MRVLFKRGLLIKYRCLVQKFVVLCLVKYSYLVVGYVPMLLKMRFVSYMYKQEYNFCFGNENKLFRNEGGRWLYTTNALILECLQMNDEPQSKFRVHIRLFYTGSPKNKKWCNKYNKSTSRFRSF